MILEKYLIDNDLFDIEKLRAHCRDHNVYFITSVRFPDLVMLHYQDKVQFDNLWTPFSRMCRGAILDLKSKTVLSYPFDKFFNLGQMPETQYEELLKLGAFQTVEKLDGSMLVAFIDPATDKVTFTTKGSFDSDHGAYANSLPVANPEALKGYAQRGTLMFELITKRFQIVIDYAKKGYPEGIYLIGFRDKEGLMASPLALSGIAEELGVPTAKTYAFETIDALVDSTKTLSVLDEGYVMRFNNGLMVKVKGTEYLRVHRFISQLSDGHLIDAMKIGQDALLIELAPEEYRDDIVKKICSYRQYHDKVRDEAVEMFSRGPKDSRKEFALWVKANVVPELKVAMFILFDNKPLTEDFLYSLVASRLSLNYATKI